MNAAEVALDELMAQFQDKDAERREDYVSIPVGYERALEVEINDDPTRETELVVIYREWDRTHGLAVEKWLSSWPIDAVHEGRVREYIDWCMRSYERDEY